MIRLNEQAPDFSAKSTHGPIQLSNYQGRWVVLFSHPADFTPVCTSEFVAFALHAQEFEDLNCSLIGLSVDSIYSHIAWTRSIEEHFGVKIPFPIIEDISMQVSAMYGMVQPAESHTAAVRTVFVIDDRRILRAMLFYPLTAGRSVGEILRLVEALQTSDKYDVGTPEGWHPGDPVIVGAPKTIDGARERLENASVEGLECRDWYFCKKPLPGAKKAA
jgi:peroxiredoxin (alkyl hydroperoxide reductase subunit C)